MALGSHKGRRHGRRQSNDGNYVYIFPANGAGTPVEIFESDTPLIVERRELLADSGGPGRMKGGLGRGSSSRSLRCLRARASREPRDAVGAVRLSAGGPFRRASRARARFLVNTTPGNPLRPHAACPGDVVTIDAPGGGVTGSRSRETRRWWRAT